MSVKLFLGDCRDTLETLAPGSVASCITSPPYFGLRSYLDADDPLKSLEIGLEKSPEEYIAKMIDVFRAVRRVLRDDGVLWLNLGDSYSGSGNGSNDHRASGASISKNDAKYQGQKPRATRPRGGLTGGTTTVDVSLGGNKVTNLPAKNLLMIPFRVAMALQADGWVLRSVIPWLKRNSMPESVTDRPSTSLEYVFLLAKSARYFWDADAVRSPFVSTPQRFLGAGRSKEYAPSNAAAGNGMRDHSRYDGVPQGNPAGRSLRNSDFFFQTWQGLLTDDNGDPLALIVNPTGYKGAHYAVFPEKLVEPLVKASTSEKGQCPDPDCGAPWRRKKQIGPYELDTSRSQAARAMQLYDESSLTVAHIDAIRAAGITDTGKATVTQNGTGKNTAEIQRLAAEAKTVLGGYYREFLLAKSATTGWEPSCAHTDLTPVPQTVLDCFGGSGTVAQVADRLGRNAILCELKDSYGDQAVARMMSEAPLFTEMDVA